LLEKNETIIPSLLLKNIFALGYDTQLRKLKNSFSIKYYNHKARVIREKKKPIDSYTSEDLGVDVTPRIKQLKVDEPPKRTKGIMVADVEELVQKLKHEAKVI
jgi:electron transfer flavoprotein alpha/beta subunit